MTNTYKVFRMAFSTILFCTGVWLLIYQSVVYKETLDHVRDSYKDKEIYQQENASAIETASYAELIAYLCNQPMYSIIVDGVEIHKELFEPEEIKTLNIKIINYQKSYLYDDNGNIKRIVYTGIDG